jgi:glycosyltransferase involved in cell wall biosynthesis
MGHPRVLFVSYHCYLDPTGGAAASTRDLLELLAVRGWACGACCGPRLDADPAAAAGALRDIVAGAETVVGGIGPLGYAAHSLVRNGVPVTVFAPDPPDPVRPPSAAESAAFVGLFDRVARAFRPDVVVTYGGDPASTGAASRAKALGLRVVFTLRNFEYTAADPFRHCSAVVVPSETAARHYRAALGLDCAVVPGPIRWDRVRCDTHDPRFLTFVNPEPVKGVFWFARVARELGTRRPDIPILVVEGRGRVDWLGRCGLDLSGVGSVHRMRNTPDPRAFYRVSRVMLMPSLWRESFGRVPVEAAINGIPTIASTRGALPESLAGGGFLLDIPAEFTPATRVPPGGADVAGWVALVEQLWDDPDFYAAGAVEARAAAVRWHPDELVPRWADVLAPRPGTPAVEDSVLPQGG